MWPCVFMPLFCLKLTLFSPFPPNHLSDFSPCVTSCALTNTFCGVHVVVSSGLLSGEHMKSTLFPSVKIIEKVPFQWFWSILNWIPFAASTATGWKSSKAKQVAEQKKHIVLLFYCTVAVLFALSPPVQASQLFPQPQARHRSR